MGPKPPDWGYLRGLEPRSLEEEEADNVYKQLYKWTAKDVDEEDAENLKTAFLLIQVLKFFSFKFEFISFTSGCYENEK